MQPLLVGVAAGLPLLAPSNIAQWCGIAPTLFRPKARFLMKVQGDSMIDVGIADADLVAIHRQDDATSGQIVMSVLTDRTTGEHDVTLKRLRVA